MPSTGMEGSLTNRLARAVDLSEDWLYTVAAAVQIQAMPDSPERTANVERLLGVIAAKGVTEADINAARQALADVRTELRQARREGGIHVESDSCGAVAPQATPVQGAPRTHRGDALAA